MISDKDRREIEAGLSNSPVLGGRDEPTPSYSCRLCGQKNDVFFPVGATFRCSKCGELIQIPRFGHTAAPPPEPALRPSLPSFVRREERGADLQARSGAPRGVAGCLVALVILALLVLLVLVVLRGKS